MMSDEEGGHPLREIVLGLGDSLNEWEQEYQDLWTLTSFAAHLSQALVAAAMHSRGLDGSRALPLLLWQQTTRYQFQSLLQFLARELDTGYAVLRNAAELARDVAFLGSHPDATQRWYDARSANRSDRTFRFDRSDPWQAAVHDIYKLASKFGTHGHITGLSSSAPVGIAGVGDRIQVRQVSTAGRDEAVAVWLLAFVPIQRICAAIFQPCGDEEFGRFFDILLEQSTVFQKAAMDLRAIATDG